MNFIVIRYYCVFSNKFYLIFLVYLMVFFKKLGKNRIMKLKFKCN